MHSNGTATRDAPTAIHTPLRFGPVAASADRRWTVILQAGNMLVMLAIALVLFFGVVPSLNRVQKQIDAESSAVRDRETEAYAHERLMELSRKGTLDQQARIVALQEQAERLAKENARLCIDINRKLRGDP